MSKKGHRLNKTASANWQHAQRDFSKPSKRPVYVPTSDPMLGEGVGKGHGGNNPNLPRIHEQAIPDDFRRSQRAGLLQPYIRVYKMGKCLILVGWSSPEGWHLSISRPDRYPDWDEIAKARYALLPANIQIGMMLPPPDEFVNVHNYCFHLHELPEDWRDQSNKVSMNEPPAPDVF